MSYILCLGNIFPSDACYQSPAISIAANKWQLGLLGALAEQGKKILVIGYLPQPVWPRGPIRQSGRSSTWQRAARSVSGQNIYVNYINVKWLRDLSLRSSLTQAIRACVDLHGVPDLVCHYNASYAAVEACRPLHRRYAVPWIPVIADISTDDEWDLMRKRTRDCNGYVILSWYAYQRCNSEMKLHLW